MVRIQIEYRSTGAVCPSLGGGEGAPWGAHRTCPTCAKIAQRALWARCPLDKRLHLLSARAVLQLAALGYARGVLLTTQDLILRGVGTPCAQCLAAGSTS